MKDMEESEISRIEEAIRAEGKTSVAKKLLKLGVITMKQISEATGLPRKKLRELRASL